jgi:hypothetical protein
VFLHPFDCDCGIEAAGFRQGGLGLVRLARLGVCGRQIRVGVILVIAEVDRLAIFVNRGFDVAETELRAAELDAKNADEGVARA